MGAVPSDKANKAESSVYGHGGCDYQCAEIVEHVDCRLVQKVAWPTAEDCGRWTRSSHLKRSKDANALLGMDQWMMKECEICEKHRSVESGRWSVAIARFVVAAKLKR